jgi:hypothetical protein
MFDIGPGPLCGGCFLRPYCGSASSSEACVERWGQDDRGGEHVLHPSRTDLRDFFDGIDGPDFATVVARPVEVPLLGEYLPQLRLRTSLRGHLRESVYGIRAGPVVGTRDAPIAATDLKRTLGLPSETRLVLLLFDKDKILERVFREARSMIPALASAGYDLIVAPSFSCWAPRPRSDHMFSLKRSLWVYGALQSHGAAAVPRVGWVTKNDATRMAEWVTHNDVVDLVGVDLMTYKSTRQWAEQVHLLQQFDIDTGRRLRYIINGPASEVRFVDLYRVVEPERLTVTNLAIARPPRRGGGSRLRGPLPMHRRFQEEIARDRARLEDARAKARRAD